MGLFFTTSRFEQRGNVSMSVRFGDGERGFVLVVRNVGIRPFCEKPFDHLQMSVVGRALEGVSGGFKAGSVRFEQFNDFDIATHRGMKKQRDAVCASDMGISRVSVEERLHFIHAPEHGRGRNGERRTLSEQVFSDGAVADVGRGPERGLLPGFVHDVEEGWVFGEQFFDADEVVMGDEDDFGGRRLVGHGEWVIG